MTRPFRTRRITLFAVSTAIAAGGVLIPTTAFAATPATPHTVVADVTDDGVRVPDGGQQWQCFAAPCDPPGGAADKGDHDRWGHDKRDHDKWDRPGKWGEHPPGRIRDGKPQWVCVVAPCEPPGGARH
ncbi:hypothetical protein [Streptomyces avidinii]|uniref:Secreted protein n=1 Tax=Streptomyces avidinii TaxID=1895 RepID=A0ABS4L484_STRAV|nr:hypothetical protein [Streptomyces avidinii]MBP2036903.1 hypothetical protein [Streptomyces avidinii]GGY93786.1 hypothetical protein GCM10010343_18760 [Streptomyces avidinii]